MGNLDSNIIDDYLKSLELSTPNIFRNKTMKEVILHKSKFIPIIRSYCDYIQSDEKIQQLLAQKNFQFILQDVEKIINPKFSKDIFMIQCAKLFLFRLNIQSYTDDSRPKI